ncbi:DUF2125 domain-containing protein [Tropicimonas sediminicola]|uniref:DUF2125 domain-containing protein n=1 Tax=Tropicimonas sediminicola TaxID=1031541 RepID=A0A239CEC9_9RHOB|nr:DUF2125 domain-containing protein [Tropicimonas sediminicola]SNS18595.1 hypothetical protein SAMN05421757_101250 [Tropicimonas sediminicola]
MKPIRLLWLTLLVALAWSAWWGWGAWRAKSDLVGWMEARRADGWQAEWGDVSVAGYPTRIDRTITDITLANTEAGWVWNAPFVQILGLNYEKDHVILVWPDSMTLQTPRERIAIGGEELRGSLTFRPGPARELDEAVLVFRDLTLASDAGWTSAVAEARLATRPVESESVAQQIGLEITGLRPRAPMMQRMAERGLVPGTIETLSADLVVTFDRPWDRSALEQARPQPREIEVRNVAASWGQLELRVAGDLTVGPDGLASGDLLVKATNWEEILEVARESGALPDGIADTVESALRLVSGLAGSSSTLDIPVTLSDGRMRMGPVPLGAAPRLRIP